MPLTRLVFSRRSRFVVDTAPVVGLLFIEATITTVVEVDNGAMQTEAPYEGGVKN